MLLTQANQPGHRHATPHNAVHDSGPVLLYAMLCIAFVLPPVSVGNLRVGAEDLITLALLPLTLIYLFAHGKDRCSPLVLTIMVLWAVIIVHGVLFGLLSSRSLLGYTVFPSEMWQYVKRAEYFVVGLYLVKYRNLPLRTGLMLLFVAFLATTLIGLAQLGSGSIANMLTGIYSRTDVQMENALAQVISMRRVFGISGFSTSWGGFAAFIFASCLALVLAPRLKAPEVTAKFRWFAALLLTLAFINVALSGSRAAILAIAAIVLFQIFVGIVVWRSALGLTLKLVAGGSLIAIAVLMLAEDRTLFLIYRFAALIDSAGGSRSSQIVIGLGLLDSWPALVNGVGNAAQRVFGVSYGIEVEPVYLLANYGILGFLLRYALVALVFVVALRLGRYASSGWSRVCGVACLNGLAAYMVFSIGYFFFQEPVAGVAPWLLFGLCAGAYERLTFSATRHPVQEPDEI